MSPRTYRPGDPEYFHATPPDDAREDLWKQFLADTGWCAPHRDSEAALASAWDAWMQSRRTVSLPLSLAQRILAALEQEAHAGDVSAARLETLAAELRAVIGK